MARKMQPYFLFIIDKLASELKLVVQNAVEVCFLLIISSFIKQKVVWIKNNCNL